MPNPFDSINDNTAPGAISDMIGAELFGGGSSGQPSEGNPALEGEPSLSEGNGAGGQSTNGTPAPDLSQPAPGATQTPALKPLPKSWKKETEALWAKADPALHEYIYSREGDMMRGLQQYSDGYKNWNEVLSPFKDILAQYPDVDAVGLLRTIGQNHLMMSHPQTPKDQKVQFAKQLLTSYGLTPQDMGFGNPNPGQADPGQAQGDPALLNRIAQLERQLGMVSHTVQSSQQSAYEAEVARQTKLITEFATNPANKYFDEVANDIKRFLESGAASDLQGAYELACYANPAVRAKYIADLNQAAQQQQQTKPSPTNISDSGTPARTRSQKPKTWQEGVDEIVAKLAH